MTIFTREGRGLLYIHVPKTGGSSVEDAFRDSGWVVHYLDRVLGQGRPNWYRACSPQHMHAAQLESLFRLDRFDGIFMTVREPIARFRSEYLMRHSHLETVPLDEASVERWALQRIVEYRRDPWLLDNHLRPQSEFYVPGALVYKLEDGLNEMARDLNAALDIDGPVDMPRVNEGGAKAGVSSRDVEISDRLRGVLQTWYAADYDLFGFDR